MIKRLLDTSMIRPGLAWRRISGTLGKNRVIRLSDRSLRWAVEGRHARKSDKLSKFFDSFGCELRIVLSVGFRRVRQQETFMMTGSLNSNATDRAEGMLRLTVKWRAAGRAISVIGSMQWRAEWLADAGVTTDELTIEMAKPFDGLASLVE